MNIWRKISAFSVIAIMVINVCFPLFANANLANKVDFDNLKAKVYAEKSEDSNIFEQKENLNIFNKANDKDNDKEYERYSKRYKEYLNLSEEEKSEMEVIPRKYDVSFDEFFKDNNNEESLSKNTDKQKNSYSKGIIVSNGENPDDPENPEENSEELLPVSFDLSNEINIINERQGDYNLCWDFASLNSLETYLQLHDLGEYNFSELHLDYLESSEFGDFSRDLHQGGNFEIFTKYVRENKGPVLENEVPYNAVYDINSYDYLLGLDPKAYVSEVAIFPSVYKYKDQNDNIVYSSEYISPNNGESYSQLSGDSILSKENIELFRNAVKKHIMENGSLYAVVETTNPYNYNTVTHSAFSSGDEINIEHAVSIIGWDDNYPKEQFLESNRPTEDGAYIVLNTWGDEFGDNGIYYVSYQDFAIDIDLCGIKNASTEINESLYNTVSFEDVNLYNAVKNEIKQYIIEADDDNKEYTN